MQSEHDEPIANDTIANDPVANDTARTWGEALRTAFHPRVIAIFFLGFTAGIPILLIFGTLSVWLREAGVERATVTFFSWAVLGYSFKFIWAPLVDRLPIPGLSRRLGRRRSWLVVSQLLVVGAMVWMAASDPRQGLVMTAIGAVLLGFSSATLDITIDAYRIEAVSRDLQAMMASIYIAGYRIGMILAGAGALKLAAYFGQEGVYQYDAWAKAYLCMAAVSLLGVITALVISEPEVARPAVDTEASESDSAGSEAHESDDHELEAAAADQAKILPLRPTSDYLRFLALFVVSVGAFIGGFVLSREVAEGVKGFLEQGVATHVAGFLAEGLRLIASLALAGLVAMGLIRARLVPDGMVRESYLEPVNDFVRRFGKAGVLVLLLIGTYRISDIMMGAVANVFYIDHGYTKDQIANVAKTFGVFMTVLGGFLGGVLSVRYGLGRALFIGAFLASLTNLLFAYLATVGNEVWMLIVVITADNLAMGMSSAAFIAFLSSLTSIRFTATQYAIFSSLMTLGPKFLAGYSGTMVDSVGYPTFFVGTAIMGIPVLVLVAFVTRLDLAAKDGPEAGPG